MQEVSPRHEEEFLHTEGGRGLEQLPGEIVVSPSLETLKIHLGRVPVLPSLGDPLLAKGSD